MILKSHGQTALSVLGLICTFGMVSTAMAHSLTAPNSPSAQNEWKGGSTGLGSSHRFPDLAAAKTHCGDIDPIVWSDGYSLTYYLPGSGYYGKATSKYGFYACKSESDAAGFHSAGN